MACSTGTWKRLLDTDGSSRTAPRASSISSSTHARSAAAVSFDSPACARNESSYDARGARGRVVLWHDATRRDATRRDATRRIERLAGGRPRDPARTYLNVHEPLLFERPLSQRLELLLGGVGW